MSRPRVYVDFHDADTRGRLRLNCVGTIRDLSRQNIALRERLELSLYDDELEVEGEVLSSPDEHIWVAVIDWAAIRTNHAVHMGDAR